MINEKLIYDAALAVEVYGEDELERYADSIRGEEKRVPGYPDDLVNALKLKGQGYTTRASAQGYELKYDDKVFRLWVAASRPAHPLMFVEYFDGARWSEYVHYDQFGRGTYV